MSTKKLTTLAMLTALTTALSLLFVLPVPPDKRCRDPLRSRHLYHGSSIRRSFRCDRRQLERRNDRLLSGYPEWALFSILIHGCQGYLTGRFRHYPLLALLFGKRDDDF